MVGHYDQGVPTTLGLENTANQKRYQINEPADTGLSISRPLCALMAVGALLLALLAGLVVFFVAPRHCLAGASPEALTETAGPHEDFLGDAVDDEVDERLPRSLRPTRYSIRLRPNFLNSTTSGTVTMTLQVLEDTNEIFFHVRNLSIVQQALTVGSRGQGSNPLAVKEQGYLKGDRYRVALETTLKKNEVYDMNVDFEGVLNGHLQGFYKSRYNDRFGRERLIASTQFSPTDARRAFPCFDEPSFKANFVITLARPQNMSTLANMPLANSTKLEDDSDWYWDTYQETPKISSYLVAFMVSDLRPGSSADTSMKVWSRESLTSQTTYAAQLAPQILAYFENYFDIEFPLPKIDIVAVPEFGFSAMENWGLITFRESSLLFDERESTNDDKRTIATVLSHEIAHQWFGNLVTPKWWDDLWLKEGFATYMEYNGVNHAEPKWRIEDEFLPCETERAMAVDALASSRPITFEVKNSRQIKQTFDAISYAKGASIIRMMNHFLGEETFKRGVISFLKKYNNSNADRDDLFASLTEAAHESNALSKNETVKHIMDTWTLRAGFPVVHCIADYEKNKLHIFQRRFYLTDREEKSTWWVPLSFTAFSPNGTNFSNTKPRFWLRGEQEIEESVDLTEWYLLNLHKTGYFVVNYDEKNWLSLVDNVMEVPPSVRAQLIADSMELARANLLSYHVPLKLIAKMAVQDEGIMFVPTWTALQKLGFLSDILSATPAFGLFEEYHRAVFKSTYEKVTFEDPVDDYVTRRIRSTVLEWSCRSPDSRCAHESRTRFRQWMISGAKIAPNLREIVYCTAIREGGEIEWDFAYRKFLDTESPSEKNMLLDALGCTRLRWLLARYLGKLSGASSIRIQDADRVFESVARNKIGTAIAFDFLRKNWQKLLDHYGDGFNILAKMIRSVAAQMNTEFQLSELRRFRESVKESLGTTSGAFDDAIETVKANVEWMEKNYHQVEQWFRKYKDHFDYIQ